MIYDMNNLKQINAQNCFDFVYLTELTYKQTKHSVRNIVLDVRL